MSVQHLVNLSWTVAELFDSLAGQTRFVHHFCAVFNCILQLVTSNPADLWGPVVPDNCVKFGDHRLNLSREIHLKPFNSQTASGGFRWKNFRPFFWTPITASRKYPVTSYPVRLIRTAVLMYVPNLVIPSQTVLEISVLTIASLCDERRRQIT